MVNPVRTSSLFFSSLLVATLGCSSGHGVKVVAPAPTVPTLDATLAPLSWLVGDWQEAAGNGLDYWVNAGGVLLGAHLGATSYAAFIIDYNDSDKTHAISFATLSDDGTASMIGVTNVAPQSVTFASESPHQAVTFARTGDALTIGFSDGGIQNGSMQATRVTSPAAPQLEAADRAFAADTHARGVAGWAAAFAADGATWSGVGGWVRGPAAIEKDMADSLQELELAWTPITSRMGPTGNVGFTIGQFTAIDRKSAAAVLHGSYITIWKQQTDGSWKVVIDSGRPAHSAVK